MTPDWLPPLILFADHGGDWGRYLEALYKHFCQDFVDSRPHFDGVKLALKRHPVIHGKEATFWHFISEGDDEAGRLPDLRRCERIRWPRPIIEASDNPDVKVWREPRAGETRIHLWVESAEYLVVLAERNGYLLPWTAYPVERERQKEKLRKRWERHK